LEKYISFDFVFVFVVLKKKIMIKEENFNFYEEFERV